jgi:hypothetical protein
MDKNVVAAMARWPDVPDVFGWLSLSERGQWRLHPRGDALDADDGHGSARGETIGSPHILQFMDRNYACDGQGQWFFQNGPQRVFVRLDAAPYILQTAGPALALRTHNDLAVKEVIAWWLDDSGRLYARTEHGPGLIAGRDLPAVLDSLRTLDNEPLIAALERQPEPRALVLRQLVPEDAAPAAGRPPIAVRGDSTPPGRAVAPLPGAPLDFCPASDIAHTLGFIRRPQPKAR